MNQIEQTAIELRYKSYTYKRIAEELKIKHGTVRSWFMKEGKLFKAYKSYKDEQNEYRLETAKTTIKRNINKAAKTLVGLLKCYDLRIRLGAARALLDREIPVKSEQIITDESAAQKIIDEVKKQDEEAESKPNNKDQGRISQDTA